MFEEFSKKAAGNSGDCLAQPVVYFYTASRCKYNTLIESDRVFGDDTKYGFDK